MVEALKLSENKHFSPNIWGYVCLTEKVEQKDRIGPQVYRSLIGRLVIGLRVKIFL